MRGAGRRKGGVVHVHMMSGCGGPGKDGPGRIEGRTHSQPKTTDGIGLWLERRRGRARRRLGGGGGTTHTWAETQKTVWGVEGWKGRGVERGVEGGKKKGGGGQRREEQRWAMQEDQLQQVRRWVGWDLRR